MTEDPYNWVTHDYYLRHKRTIEEMQSDLESCSSACAYSWIKKANITSETVRTTERVLDIGCGYGREIYRYKNSVGIDLCVPFIKTAKHYSDNEFIVASAEYLPFKSGVFACVIMSEVIEHINQQEKTIVEAKRVLMPDRRFIVQTPNRSLTRFRKISQRFGHVHEFNAKELKALLSNNGFNIIKVTGSTIPYIPTDSSHYHLNFNRFFFALWRFLNWLIPIKWDIIILAKKPNLISYELNQ